MIKEKILIISAPNPERHAGIAAKNIYDLFKKNGHETIIISKEESSNNPDFISFPLDSPNFHFPLSQMPINKQTNWNHKKSYH